MSDRTSELRARIGLAPDAAPAAYDPADTTAWLVEQVTESLNRATPRVFTQTHPLNRDVADWIAAYIADPAGTKSLLLVGSTGNGKTHQAWQALRGAVIGAYQRNVRPTWRAVNHPDFIAETRPSSGDAHVDALRKYADAGLLLFDDLGAEDKPTEWSVTTLYRLVNHRWENGLPTIWTSNRNAAALTPLIGDRSLSRIWSSRRVVFDGPDFRKASA